MSDLDYIARQNAELQQRVDGLEQTIERRVRGNLERVFADRLDNAMRGKDAELTFLKTKVKMFETELGRRGDSGFTPDYRKAQLLGGRSLANFDVRETIQNVKGAVQNFSFASYVTYIAMAQLFLCYLTNIARFDLFCAVVIVAIYATHEMDRLAMAAYLGFMVFSIIMDIVWMSQHSDTSMFAVTATFEGTMQFVFAMTLIAMLLKILILFPAISTFRTLPLVKPSEQRGNRPPLSPFVRVLDGLFVLQLAFCFFNSLARADLYAVVIMIGLYAVHENDKFAMKAYYFFTAVTVVVDIIYLGLHGSEEYNNIRQNNLASTEPKSFVYGTTICNLLIKIIFAFVTMKLFREMPDRKPSESQPSMEAMPGSGFSRITHIALGSNERATIVMLALQFVFVLFESLARLDVFSVVLVIGMYAVNEKDKVALESYFVASFLPSFIMDIVWLAEHQDAAKFAWQAGSSATVTFAMILVVLNMILKLGILIPAIRFHTELPDVKPSEQHGAGAGDGYDVQVHVAAGAGEVAPRDARLRHRAPRPLLLRVPRPLRPLLHRHPHPLLRRQRARPQRPPRVPALHGSVVHPGHRVALDARGRPEDDGAGGEQGPVVPRQALHPVHLRHGHHLYLRQVRRAHSRHPPPPRPPQRQAVRGGLVAGPRHVRPDPDRRRRNPLWPPHPGRHPRPLRAAPGPGPGSGPVPGAPRPRAQRWPLRPGPGAGLVRPGDGAAGAVRAGVDVQHVQQRVAGHADLRQRRAGPGRLERLLGLRHRLHERPRGRTPRAREAARRVRLLD